jgi:hypothetical protein
MKENKKSFKLAAGILLVAAAVLIGFAGWNMWRPRDSADKTGISFENESSLDSKTKQEILTKVAEPFVYYHEEILDIDLKNVVIDVDANRMGPDDFRYKLTYHTGDDKQESGFLFGANNRIGYWLPGACDEGGCTPYPEDFKQEYPATYDAYAACETARNANDKDKMNEVCAP